MDHVTSSQDYLRQKRLAEIFLKKTKEIDSEEKILEAFESLGTDVQKLVLVEVNRPWQDRIIKSLPYKKFQDVYKEIISSKPNQFVYLINGIAEFYHEDAEDFLSSIFQTDEDADVCAAVAEGLARSTSGLTILENGIQGSRTWQQVGAIKGIVKAANEDKLLEILDRYKDHENYQVRLECIFGYMKTKTLSQERISSALRDRSEHIRYRMVHLIRNIDETIAKDFVTLLEDERGYIVSEVIEVLEKDKTHKLDESAIANAIISELIIRESGRPKEYFNADIVSRALSALFNWNARLYGETMKSLCDIAFDYKNHARRHAVLVAVSLDERGFLSLINEYSERNPDALKEILNLVTGNFDSNLIVNQISDTDPSDIQQNAANQIKLLSQYHESGLQQAKTSFNWAIALSLAGFPFLMFAIYYIVVNQIDSATSILSAVASSVVELIAGTLFYLYNQTRKQLTYYHKQMNQIQRFLLANSVAESLEGIAKENARTELIKTIATSDLNIEQ